MKFGKILFYLILIIFPFGQLLAFKLPFLSSSIRIQPLDLAVFVFLLNWFFFVKDKSGKPFYFWPAIIFLSFAFLSFALKFSNYPFSEQISGLFYLLRLGNYIFLPWALYDLFKKENIKVFKWLIFIGLTVAGLSLLQYLFLPDTRFLVKDNWDDHLFRAVGPFLDPGFNGLILVLSSIILWVEFLAEKEKRNKIFLLIGGIVLAVSVGLSFSRMNYLLFVISLIIIFLIKKQFKLLLFLLLFFSFSIAVFPKPTGEGVDLLRKSTSFAKLENYKTTISVIKDNFWTGVGYNFLRPELFKRGYLSPLDWQETHSGSGSDNSFLFILATTGIFGFSAYLYLWFSIIKENWGNWTNWGNSGKIILFTTGTCMIVSAFFINSLFYPWIMLWLGIVLSFKAGTDK